MYDIVCIIINIVCFILTKIWFLVKNLAATSFLESILEKNKFTKKIFSKKVFKIEVAQVAGTYFYYF